MKRTTKILAFALACIFCFAAMSFGIFAEDGCSDHGYQNWYTVPGSRPDGTGGICYYHDFYCGICGSFMENECCVFGNTYDCTEAPRCMWCNQANGNVIVYSSHSYSGTWSYNSSQHYMNCGHEGCLESLAETHIFIETIIGGTVYLVCVVCGYNRAK